MFELGAHPEAQAWIPKEPELSKLRNFFVDPSMKVKIYPRSMVKQVLGRHAPSYAFRGFTRGDTSHLFVDSTETPKSIAWLMAHELTHQMVGKSPTLTAAFDDAKPLDMEPAGDPFHDVDAEERFCDGIATRLLGYRQDRAWWRRRLSRRSAAR